MVKTQNMNALLLLGVFLLQTLAKPFNGTLDDISWIIGENDDSVVDTCRRIGQQPLNTDLTTISWNRTSFDYVVRNILQLNYVGTGLSGCCTSGLWCDGGNCFSQSFGESFINYGRLPNVGDSVKPVFACIKSDKESFVQINKVLLAEKSRLDITGNGLDSGATTEGFLYGERCNNVELCGCQSCSAAVSCSAGSSCYLSSSSPQSFCFELCAGTNDASCPCDRICKNVKDTTGKSVSLCLPPSFTTFVNNCNTFGNDRFMCTANSSLYLSTAGVTNPNISVLVENYGITAKLGPLPTSCKSSADCFDNNLCTIDECVSSMCVYSSAGNCSSVLPHLREQYSPYSYVQYEANDLFHEQQEFAEELVESGQYFAINSKALSTFNTFKVDFWISYFGNLLNSFSISGSGVVSLPPLDDCDNKQCDIFTSASNAISPWFSRWTSGGYYVYVQTTSSKVIRGMAANAFHVLFENMQQSGMDAKTFGVSIYEDGSIKMSYLSDALYDERDFFGLWGSFVSTSPSFLRYHSETLETVELLNGTDTVFCPLNTTACVQEACISPSNMLSINWNGTNTCNALGPNIKYSLECQWYGGMATSNASLYVRTSASTHSGVLTCAVPIFNVTDGTVIPVEILQIIEYGDNVSNVSYRPQQLLYGSKFVHGVYISPSTEITRANLMVRYFSSGSVNKCGCNALEDYSQMSCNSQNICAYGAAKFAEDCAGTPFGSAYFDACGKCAGGYTKQIPVFQCSVDDDQFLSLITQTIILLVIICCLTLITSSVSYAIRRMLVQRATNEAMLAENEMALQMLEVNVGSAGSSRRGLSEFECEALGLVVFTKSLLKKDNLPGKDDEAAQNDSNDCPICLMELQEGIICRMLPEPCGHIFHQQCIDQWFKQSTVCPLCKRSMKMVFEEEHVHERPSGTRRHVADGSNVDSVGRIRDFMSNRRPRNHGNYSNVNDNNSYLPAESSQVVQSRSAEPGTYEI